MPKRHTRRSKPLYFPFTICSILPHEIFIEFMSLPRDFKNKEFFKIKQAIYFHLNTLPKLVCFGAIFFKKLTSLLNKL